MTTIEDITIDITMAGMDLAAAVQPAQKDLPPAVLVLTTSKSALQRLSNAGLRAIVDELGDQPMTMPDGSVFDGRTEEPLTLQSAVSRVFRDAHASPRHWLMFTFPLGKMMLVAFVFSGPVCERIAAVCNKAGAPCSLNDKEAAPGWIIDRTIERRISP